jgi:hypothetical protein
MEFLESWMTQSRTSPAKTTNRWLDPSADPLAQQALVDAGILKAKALADAEAQKQKEKADAAAALLAQREAGLSTGGEDDSNDDSKDPVQPPMPTTGGPWTWNEDLFEWVETKTPAPTGGAIELTVEQDKLLTAFEEKFAGLANIDQLRKDILSGAWDLNRTPLSTLPTDASAFNNMVRDAKGRLPGGYATPNYDTGEGGVFVSSQEGDYSETYLTEPQNNDPNKAGVKPFIQQTLLDGRTVWERNTDYVPDNATGPGSQNSIDRTNQLTDSERNTQLAAAGVESATAILTRLAGAFGLPVSVVSKLKKFMIDGLSEEAIALEIRQTDEYKTRFPGMELRRDNGFGAITEAEYMKNEDEYAMLLRTHGLPPRFYDDRMDFANLIAADVSPNEFGERVTLAELAEKGADPNTKAELKRLYGVDKTDLVAYYLDPEGAANLIEERRAFEAAGLSATAARVVGTATGFDKETASALQREGVQRREIQSSLTPQVGLTNQILGEEDGISVSDLAQSQFGLNPEAANKVRRRREERTTGFSGEAGMLISGTGASGLGAST